MQRESGQEGQTTQTQIYSGGKLHEVMQERSRSRSQRSHRAGQRPAHARP
jgi:hypothetical protein